uniref:Uncharacterized protein n=1 Tax=Panagrellus redivivus TaxID=6233 RepID=A0A7E5A222_PANRE
MIALQQSDEAGLLNAFLTWAINLTASFVMVLSQWNRHVRKSALRHTQTESTGQVARSLTMSRASSMSLHSIFVLDFLESEESAFPLRKPRERSLLCGEVLTIRNR